MSRLLIQPGHTWWPRSVSNQTVWLGIADSARDRPKHCSHLHDLSRKRANVEQPYAAHQRTVIEAWPDVVFRVAE